MQGWELAVVAGVLLLLFGGSRLPKLARSLGEARTEMDKVRKEIAGEGPDDDDAAAAQGAATPAAATSPVEPVTVELVTVEPVTVEPAPLPPPLPPPGA